MMRILSLLFLLTLFLAGCGSKAAAPTPTPFCQNVSTVKDDVASIKALKGNITAGALTTDLQKLKTDLTTAISETKGSAAPQVDALKSSLKQLQATLKQVKDRTLTVSAALPTAKSQAQAVSNNWKALTNALKCS